MGLPRASTGDDVFKCP